MQWDSQLKHLTRKLKQKPFCKFPVVYKNLAKLVNVLAAKVVHEAY